MACGVALGHFKGLFGCLGDENVLPCLFLLSLSLVKVYNRLSMTKLRFVQRATIALFLFDMKGNNHSAITQTLLSYIVLFTLTRRLDMFPYHQQGNAFHVWKWEFRITGKSKKLS